VGKEGRGRKNDQKRDVGRGLSKSIREAFRKSVEVSRYLRKGGMEVFYWAKVTRRKRFKGSGGWDSQNSGGDGNER